MILGDGICGNTHSYKVEVIFPHNSYRDNKTEYFHQNFISKEYPLIVPNKYGIELFYYQQEWGGNGTAVSYYVPHNIGFKLLLANPTDKNISISHEDSRFNIITQAKDDSGTWKNIEHLPHSTCGNSYGTKQLSAHKVWVFSAPIYDGDTKVKLRYKMGDTISNEFDGMINKEQFSVKWRDPNDPFDWLYGDLSFDSDR